MFLSTVRRESSKARDLNSEESYKIIANRSGFREILNGAQEKLEAQVSNLADPDPVQPWIINSPKIAYEAHCPEAKPSKKQGLRRVVEPEGYDDLLS